MFRFSLTEKVTLEENLDGSEHLGKTAPEGGDGAKASQPECVCVFKVGQYQGWCRWNGVAAGEFRRRCGEEQIIKALVGHFKTWFLFSVKWRASEGFE